MSREKTKKALPEGMTAAELYEVQPYYRRFNHKYNMTRQGMWNESAGKINKLRVANLKKFIEGNHSGYGLPDWGFFNGARANLENTGFNVNRLNMFGNSWEPVSNRTLSGRYPKPDQGFSKWHGSPEEASRLIRKLGLNYFGADLIGFCRLDRRWVYSHWFDEETKQEYPIRFSDEAGFEEFKVPVQLADRTQVIPKEMKYAVVLLYEMDEDAMATSPALTAMAGTQVAYSRISFTTVSVAEFIRGLGYNAIPSSNFTALSIPLAIDAGLGQLGRNAKLINHLFGPRCRISKVITDLPLEAGEPIDLGVTEFCNQCMKCAKSCPTEAIPFGGRTFEPVNECNHSGVLQWQLDHKRCAEYWAKVGTNCGICIRTCPFNKGRGKIHSVTRWFIKNFRFMDPLFLKLDDIMGYGKFHSPEGFWAKE